MMAEAAGNDDKATGPQVDGVKYVLLCRHAPHDNGTLKPKQKTSADQSSSANEGKPMSIGRSNYPTQDVARVLREELLYERQIVLDAMLYAPTPESIGTARFLRDGLNVKTSVMPPRSEHPALGRKSRNCNRMNRPTHQTGAQPLGAFGVVATTKLDVDANIENQPYSLHQCDKLNPALRREESFVAHARECLASYFDDEEAEGNAVLVVGHQPQLSWLSDQLTGGHGWRLWRHFQWWGNGPVPISPGEVVCLRIEKRRSKRKWSGHLLWSIHPDDKTRLADVREKVQSKLKTAELLAAVLGLAIAAVLALLLDRTRWRNLAYDGEERREKVQPFGFEWDRVTFEPRTGVQCAVAMLLAALALYLMTVFAYDSLRMPPAFWSENPPHRPSDRPRRWLPRRPPSSSAWIIYRNMMRIWGMLFVPATLLVIAAFTTLAVSLLDWNPTIIDWLPGLGILAAVLLWKRFSRPILGSDD